MCVHVCTQAAVVHSCACVQIGTCACVYKAYGACMCVRGLGCCIFTCQCVHVCLPVYMNMCAHLCNHAHYFLLKVGGLNPSFMFALLLDLQAACLSAFCSLDLPILTPTFLPPAKTLAPSGLQL